MDLETVIDTYGWSKYYPDNTTGNIYCLPEAYIDDQGRTIVPVSFCYSKARSSVVVKRIPPKQREDSY